MCLKSAAEGPQRGCSEGLGLGAAASARANAAAPDLEFDFRPFGAGSSHTCPMLPSWEPDAAQADSARNSSTSQRASPSSGPPRREGRPRQMTSPVMDSGSCTGRGAPHPCGPRPARRSWTRTPLLAGRQPDSPRGQGQYSTTWCRRSTHPASPASSLYWICRLPPLGSALLSPSRYTGKRRTRTPSPTANSS